MCADVLRVLAVVGSFESVSAAAAAVVVYVAVVGVVVAVPACCRPSALSIRHEYIPVPGTNFETFFPHYNPNFLTLSFCLIRAHTETGVWYAYCYLYMRCCKRCCLFAHHIQVFCFRTVSCRYRSQPTFLFTPRQLSTAAAAVVVQT